MIKSLQKQFGGGFKRVLISCITAVFLLTFSPAWSQELIVSGQITDRGNPVPGVSIVVKGTAIGTTTDAEGKYKLAVGSGDAMLVFSFIGYKTQEIAVGNQTVVDVSLQEDVRSLNEVVVTALGVQRDVKSLGYAVQKVDGAAMVKAREPNIMNSLTGRVAGLEIHNQTDLFQDPDIKLRGAKPLIVIDGVPSVDNDLWKINADDIESYNVLKGATASALYGSIGGGGAIMITTKRGMNKTKVDVNSSTMFQPDFIRIPDVQHTYGNGNYGQYEYVDGSGSGLEGGGWIWGPKLDQRDPTTKSGFWETTQYNSPVDPNTGQLVPLPFISRGKDNVKNFFRTGIISTNNISVSGGNETSNFRVSVSNLYQRGIVPNTDLNNTSFAVSGGFKLTQKLKADASLTYNRQYTDNYPEIEYGPQNYLYNLVLWIGPDIDIRDLKNYWVKGQEGVQQQNYNKSWYNNPYFQANQFQRGYYKDNVFGQFKLDYNILPGFDLTLRTGINEYGLNRTWKESKSYIAYDYVSRGNFTIQTEFNLNLNTDFIARYTKKISENFTVTASGGGADRWRIYRFQEQKTDGLVIPEFFNLSNSENPLRGKNLLRKEKVNSLYATLDLELFHGIYLGGTVRNDWVSTLPVKNNSFFYPSLSASGIISDFVDLQGYKISFLKIRGSWSRVGNGRITDPNDDKNPYYHIQAYDTGPNWHNIPSLTTPASKKNPEIKPETSDTYEVGADVRFLEGRLGIDFATYRVRDFNNIITSPVSITSLYSSNLTNGGEYMRKGIEITLTGTPIKGEKFSWNVIANWSRYHKYQLSKYSSVAGNSSSVYLTEGSRTDQILGYTNQRTPGGKLILQQSSGYPIGDPFIRRLGYYDADFIFGLINNFSYGPVSLQLSFDGRVGGKMYSTTNQKMWWGGSHPGTVNQYRDDANNGLATYVADGVVVVEGSAEYDNNGNIISDNRVYAPNTKAVNYIQWNQDTSNGYLTHYYDQSFVKLREITLSFNVPASVLAKTFFQKASISFVGRNLALWTRMPNVDPDNGKDNLQTPSTRNYGFNVNFTF